MADLGAPIAKDQLDPELVSLRRAAPKIGMVTAAAIVVTCVVYMVRLRHDFAFARHDGSPRAVTAADVVAGKVDDDSYVTLTAPLDRAAAIRERVSEASAGERVVPVVGTDDKLWIAVPADPWSAFHHDEIVTGRLRPMSDVRFSSAVAHYASSHPRPRFVGGDDLRRARAASADGATLPLLGGGSMTVKAADEVEIIAPDPNRAIVIASYSERLPDAKAWHDALVAAKVIAPDARPLAATDELVRWEVTGAGVSASLGKTLDDAGLWGARVEAATARVRVAWSKLAVSDAGVAGPTDTIPWSAIDVAAIWAPRPVPAGARVVLVDEKPGSYWYLPPVYVGLGLFSLLFTWALVLAVRRQFFDRPPAAAASPAKP